MNALKVDVVKVLFVDDRKADFEMIRSLLGDADAEGIVLDWADTYDGGLDAIRSGRHDLILLDLHLSSRTGLEMLAETESVLHRAPVILITGQSDNDVDERAIKAGATDCLVRDHLKSEMFKRAIRYAVERRKTEEALRLSEDRYRTFATNSAEGNWCFELERPLKVNLPASDQLAHLDRYAYLAECNEATAHIYGYEHSSEIVGLPLREFISTAEGIEGGYLLQLIRNEYLTVSAEELVSNRYGEPKFLLHYLVGVVEHGCLIRIWGRQNDISEQKRSRNALAQLAAIVESSDDAIYSKTPDGLIVTWNLGAENLYGYTAQEVTGQAVTTFTAFSRPEDIRLVQEQVARGEHISQFETVHRHKSGKLINVSLAVSPIFDATGRVTGSSSIARDITERKQAEAKLRRSEASLSIAQHLGHFGSWELELVNTDNIYANSMHWSDETFRIFGYEPGAVLVTSDLFFGAIPADEQPRVRQAMVDAASQRQPVSLVHHISYPNGEERTVQERALRTEADASSQPDTLIGIVHDITAQREAEKSITFNALLLSQVRNAVIATDLEGRITHWNKFAEKLYMWKAEEVLGRNIADVIVPEQDQESADLRLREIYDAGNWESEVIVQRKDRSTFPAYVAITVFQDASGDTAGMVGVSIDISTRKAAEANRGLAEEALRLSEQRLRLALESGRFGTFYIDFETGLYRELSDIARSQFEGLPEGNVSISDFFQIVHPDDVAEVQGAVARAAAAHESDFNSDYRIVLPSGQPRWINVRGTIIYDDSGLATGMIGVTQDITDRKRSEELLERTNREIVTTWESMTDAFLIVDKAWRLTYINSHGALLLQKTKEDLEGADIWEAFPEAVGSTFYTEYHRAHEEQVAVAFEEYYAPLDRWMDVHAYPSAVGLSVYFRDISERKHAESALYAAEQEQRQLAMHLETERSRLTEAQAIAKVGSWELDLRNWDVVWSDETYRIYGCERAKFGNSYSAVLEYIHIDDRAHVNEAFKESLAKHIPYSSDHRIVLDDGTVKFVHERCRTIYDEDDTPLRSIGTSQDITQQKESEQERDRFEESLRRSESRFRSVVEKVESLVIHDQKGNLVEVNQNACDSLGYTREELLQLNVAVYEMTYEAANVALLWAQMASGAVTTTVVDGLHRRKDGSTFPVEVRVGLMELEGPSLMVAVARNVTDRKQAEVERDRFFTLSLDMLAIINNDGYIKRLNPAWETTLGFTDTELMAKPYLEFVHPDDIAATLIEAAKLETGALVVRFENRYICRDGSYKWLRWMCAPFAELWYCVAHDITAIKNATEALHQANEDLEIRVAERTTQLQASHLEMRVAKEEAERANAAKSEFLSRMSHELRTPMNSILGFAQIMELDAPTGKQATRVAHILKAGQHLLQLINEVLDLARVESGRLQLSLEKVSLGTSILTAVGMMRPLCEQRGQHITCQISECGSLYVQADQQRLSQVIINLLSNATKYSRDGGDINIQCEQHREGWQRVSISDSGAGINAEQIGKLFQPFERLDAANGPIEGTGLGLALSKRLMELMGGSISVQSVVGSGSTFTIELREADSAGMEPQSAQLISALPRAHVQQDTILYIEDNPANLHLIEDLISSHMDYQILSAETGQLGLKMARELLPSLILLDLHLPDLPGDEVLVRLQADLITRNIPVLIISADATSGQIARLLAAGAIDYLTKPLDVRLFNDVLQKILQSSQGKGALN